MNQRQAIISAVIAKPGSTMREVAKAIGLGERDDVTSVSAQLSQLCIRGKLRRDNPRNPRVNAPHYWPTETATVDLRKVARTPAQIAQHAEACVKREAAKRAQREREALTKIPAVAASPKAHKPAPASRVRIVDPPRPPKAQYSGTAPETVAEFLARGGQIQRLAFGQCNNDLRFDHSGTTTFEQRRPVVRAYPAAGVL